MKHNKPNVRTRKKASTIFPWTYFIKIARLHGLILIVSVLSSFFIQRYFFKSELQENYRSNLIEKFRIYKEVFNDSDKIKLLCQKIPLPSNMFLTVVNKELAPVCQNPVFSFTQFNPQFLIDDFKDLKIKTIHKKFRDTSHDYYVAIQNLDPGYKLIVGSSAETLQSRFFDLDKSILSLLLPLIVFTYLFLLWSSFQFSKPLKSILFHAYKLSRKLPRNFKNFQDLSEQDEWKELRKTLSMTEESMDNQLKIIKQEDEKNRILLESITDGIIAIDPNEKTLFYNTRFSNKFLKKLTLKKQYSLEEIFQDNEILESFRTCLKTATSCRVKDFKIFHKNRTLYYDIIINPIIEEEHHKIHGAVGVFHNVTEAKLTEQMRVDFVANVSHEIRTPLTSIKGFSQVLKSQEKRIPDELKDYLDKIISNTERLHTLFQDLLELSVIESKHRLKKKEINLKKMVENVKAMLLQNYRQKKINIEYDIPIETINVDPKLFEQVLINLVDNACKYAGNEPTIKISNFEDGDNLIITISDNGPGISREHLGRVFERFYRIDSSRQKGDEIKAHGGTGLGLSIVKHIINKHKGKIWVESEENRGTIFFIEIPHTQPNIQLYHLPEHSTTHHQTPPSLH
ncbi:MAG: GHKL domain-containing protein [Halobacteriovoraceae bacterium]|nr:GHKL domain-containing protein [Halobacteriovoraceae bacterium]MCB9093845.1 GHKL domain-containing protein [Halobacteriovoraceae bacterium]